MFKRGELGEGAQVAPAAFAAFDEQMKAQRKLLRQDQIQQLREQLLHVPYYRGIDLIDTVVAENNMAKKVFAEMLHLLEHTPLRDANGQVIIDYLKQRLERAVCVLD